MRPQTQRVRQSLLHCRSAIVVIVDATVIVVDISAEGVRVAAFVGVDSVMLTVRSITSVWVVSFRVVMQVGRRLSPRSVFVCYRVVLAVVPLQEVKPEIWLIIVSQVLGQLVLFIFILIIIFCRLHQVVADLILRIVGRRIHLNFHGLLARPRISDVELLELRRRRRGSLGHDRRRRRRLGLRR